jgi:hypothetical protein
MNRYLIISRLRWPALLLLTGVIALLSQMHVLSWGRAWPLYLILLGVLALAERAALAADPSAQNYPYPGGNPGGYQGGYQPGYGPQGGPYPTPGAGAPSPDVAATQSTGIVPAHTDLEVRSNESRADFRHSDEEEGR